MKQFGGEKLLLLHWALYQRKRMAVGNGVNVRLERVRGRG